MLTDVQIDRLIQPILDRQTKIEAIVIIKIAERLKDIGEVTPSDVRMLTQLGKTGSDVRAINKEIARLSKLNERQIKKIIRQVAQGVYDDAKPLYDYRHRFIPLERNQAMQSVINAIESVTVSRYTNIANSTALRFLWRDFITGALAESLSISDTYQKAVDLAIQSVSTGVMDYGTMMQKTLTTLVNSGINTVVYESDSGRITHQRVDSAVRRNLLDGVRAVSQAMQDEIGKQVGTDGVELSVHAMSAPDHEPIQGHQFTDEEYEKCQTQQDFEDVLGNQFLAINRPIGVWNCRHFAYRIILEITKPIYTPEQLEKLKQANAKGYTFTDSKGNKKHFTMYECTQRQRQYELAIRKAREGKLAGERSGNEKLLNKYTKRLNDLINEYTIFSKSCGLRPQYMRTKVVL